MSVPHSEYVGPCPCGSTCDACDGDRRYRRCANCMDDGCDECSGDLSTLIDAAAHAASLFCPETMPCEVELDLDDASGPATDAIVDEAACVAAHQLLSPQQEHRAPVCPPAPRKRKLAEIIDLTGDEPDSPYVADHRPKKTFRFEIEFERGQVINAATTLVVDYAKLVAKDPSAVSFE